jgi:hypothetical protein
MSASVEFAYAVLQKYKCWDAMLLKLDIIMLLPPLLLLPGCCWWHVAWLD